MKVATSPNLGGEILVTFRQVKHWETVIDDVMESEHGDDFIPDDELMVDEVPILLVLVLQNRLHFIKSIAKIRICIILRHRN